MADYAEVIDSVGNYEHEFILKVLDLFPVNNFATMNLLGTSEEIDNHIFEQKINIDTLVPNEDSGYKAFLEWCAHKKGQKPPLRL